MIGEPHRQAESLAAEAATAEANGRKSAALELFWKAAILEQIAFNETPLDKFRTRSILAISFVSLLYKAGRFDEAQAEIITLMDSRNLLPWAEGQLRDLQQTMTAEVIQGKAESRWALLIGIDNYPNFQRLSGCVNDVKALAQVLIDHLEFPQANVFQLLDETATQEGIRSSWEQMLLRVGKEDVVVFQFCGYGSQMRDREGTKPDGWDETIVPFDSGRGRFSNRDISADEIYFWLRRLTSITTNVTVIFDSCHSGGMTRDPFGDNARCAPRDERPVNELPPSPVSRGEVLERAGDKGPSGWLPVSRSYTLLASCRGDERCHESWTDSNTQGVFTYFLSRELARVRPGSTFREVFEAFAPLVISRYCSQHPQLEGAWDREIFGVKDFTPMIFLPVHQRETDKVVLGGGQVFGVEEGSTWSVYRGNKRKVRIGTIEVIESHGAISLARILSETSPGAVRPGSRAIEETRKVGELTLSVEVVTSKAHRREGERLLAEIKRSRILRSVEAGEKGDVRVYLIAPRMRVGPGDPVPLLGSLSEPVWAVVGRGDDLLLPLHRVQEYRAIPLIGTNLENLARYRYVLALDNPQGPLRGTIDLSLLRRKREGSWVEANDINKEEAEYFEGEFFAVKISSSSSLPLYFVAFDFGLSGRMAQFYPAAGLQDPLKPGGTLRIGTREGEEMRLGFPRESPFNPWDDRSLGGIETVKVFAASQKLDFHPFVEAAFRGRHWSPNALERLLIRGFSPTSEMYPVSIHVGEDLWTTAQRSFRLKPRDAIKAEE